MKSKLITAVAWLALSPLAANADVITDTTTFHAEGTNSAEDYVAHNCGTVNFIQGSCSFLNPLDRDFVTWDHIFDMSGVGTLVSATLELWFSDDGRGLNELVGEWFLGVSEQGIFQLFGDANGTSGPFDVAVASLNDGTFRVTVLSLAGDFFIDRSVLTINHSARAVPEPSTLALFGLGLLGVGLARRKKAKV